MNELRVTPISLPSLRGFVSREAEKVALWPYDQHGPAARRIQPLKRERTRTQTTGDMRKIKYRVNHRWNGKILLSLRLKEINAVAMKSI